VQLVEKENTEDLRTGSKRTYNSTCNLCPVIHQIPEDTKWFNIWPENYKSFTL